MIDQDVINQISKDILEFEKDKNGIKLFKDKLLENFSFSDNESNLFEEYDFKNNDLKKIVSHAESYIYGLDTQNSKLLDALIIWHNKDLEDRICEVCGTKFKPICIHYPKLIHKNVCLTCPILEDASPEKIISTLLEIKNKFGFVEFESFDIADEKLASRFSKTQWPLFIKLYAKTGGIDNINKHFGSWIGCLIKTGLLK